MARRFAVMIVVALAAVLSTSFSLNQASGSFDDVPATPLAFAVPTEIFPSLADDAPVSIAVPVPHLPESVLITDTRVAVMPSSLRRLDVVVAPRNDADHLITFDRLDEFGQVRVFRVLATRDGFHQVQVPMRPNETTGWIRADDVELTSTDQRILIDLSDRTVVVWDGDDVVFDATGTTGAPATPTPTGTFYVRNVFDWYADSIYGPYVIPLSAYSEAIDKINGGDAVIAIHGTRRPDLVGAAASLGCVRLENDVLRELAAIVEPGAPVEIVP